MRTFLVLARVSNLPTVWSNCLAAWLLTGGASWARFSLLCLGATLLYTGGMFLNDAVDEGFDRRYRPERPIVAGLISSRKVWWLSSLWLLAGWLIFLWLGKTPALVASLLLVTIVLYDVVHKRTPLAPLLMAACRFFLYLLAGSVGNSSGIALVFTPAVALAAYIVGLSYLARGESTGRISARWTVGLLVVPVLVACWHATAATWVLLTIATLQTAWTLWCLFARRLGPLALIPHGIAGLLAGIALVDWLAAMGRGCSAAFVCLFVLALLLQRVAPAT